MTATVRTLARSDAVVLEVAKGPTYADIARNLDVSERTVRRLAAADDFADRVAEARKRIYHHASEALAAATTDAVGVLRVLMTGAESEPVRVRAALGVLSEAMRWRDSIDVEARLRELEARLGIGDQP